MCAKMKIKFLIIVILIVEWINIKSLKMLPTPHIEHTALFSEALLENASLLSLLTIFENGILRLVALR